LAVRRRDQITIPAIPLHTGVLKQHIFRTSKSEGSPQSSERVDQQGVEVRLLQNNNIANDFYNLLPVFILCRRIVNRRDFER
jgi:hypothetical protein